MSPKAEAELRSDRLVFFTRALYFLSEVLCRQQGAWRRSKCGNDMVRFTLWKGCRGVTLPLVQGWFLKASKAKSTVTFLLEVRSV